MLDDVVRTTAANLDCSSNSPSGDPQYAHTMIHQSLGIARPLVPGKPQGIGPLGVSGHLERTSWQLQSDADA